jgi:hypothetical protein
MTPIKKRALWLVNIALLIIASSALLRILTKESPRSFDFHCFWYGGNLVWQGENPYRAFIEKRKVTLPITYMDGATVQQGPIDPFDIQCVPGNSAPVVFLLAPLARFSWDTAHNAWFILNVLFSIAMVWTLLKILNQGTLAGKSVLLLLLVIVQLSTRETLEFGQTSLLITLCMFLSMFFSYCDRTRSRAVVSGIFLGIALSKPLLSFPLLLLFLYRRRAVELVTAVFIQIAGIYGITLLGTGAPVVIADYFRIFMMHAGPGTQDGMYLTAGLLKEWTPYSYFIIAAGSIPLAVLFYRWLLNNAQTDRLDIRIDLVFFTALMLWNLLVFYHRRYDYVAASSFLALMVFLPPLPFRAPSFSLKQQWGIYGTVTIAVVFWILPFYRVMGTTAYRSFFNIVTLAALCLSVWLLFRLSPDHRQNEPNY